EGVLYTPVPKERQAAAVKFLNENAFATPTWMVRPEILRRIETDGVLARIKSTQQSLLMQLLSASRFNRLTEQEAMDGDKSYRTVDLLADVRKGVWGELNGAAAIKIDAYRRNLQRGYLDLLGDKLNGRAAVTDDQRPFIRGELRALNADVAKAMVRTTDRATRMHLEDVKDQIAKILDPKFAAPAPAAATGLFGRLGLDGEELPDESLGCWQDYSIRIRR
ncbi:MAG: zinc-dependent metalloprotease, partial [Acidobacteriota bacterium]|nr:zinc-dependent metalloprotease [Acidobacteriota bacterium]